MNKSSRHFKLGLFVISAVILLAAAVIALAGRRWGTKEYPAYTTLDESVQGLEVGSPVKFRGVPIGSVRKITIQDEDLDVRVDMELYEGSIQIEDMTIREFLRQQIHNGARCRLEITGITGFRYIEIQMIPPKQLSDAKRPPGKDAKGPLYIPSMRSVLAGVTADLTYTLAEIAEIDFNSIGRNMDQLLTKFNQYMQDERIGKAIDHLSTTSRELSKLARKLSQDGIGATMTKINNTLHNLNGLVSEVHDEVKKAKFAAATQEISNAAEKVKAAAESVDQASIAARDTISKSQLPQSINAARQSLSEMQADLTRTTNTLNNTLEAIERFTELLEKDTGALLHGKQIPQVEMGRESNR